MNAHLLTHTHISRMALYAAFLFIGVMCSVGNAWGTEGTLTITRSCFPSGELAYNATDDWTATASTGETILGQGDLYSTQNQTTMQTKNTGVSTHYHNLTAIPGAITKIEVDLASGTDRVYNVYASATAAITSTAGLSPIGRLTEGCAVDISTAYNYRYFALQCTGGASTLNNIVITYETVPGKAIFTRIDAVGDLKDGDEIIFVNQAETYACAMRQNDNNRAIKPITVSSHKYTYVPSDSVQVFTVKINASSQYGFHAGAGHLYSLSGKNQIKTNSDNLCTNPSGNAAWTLSASSSVFSVTNVSNTSYLMQFNGTSYFAQYTTAQIKPYIFKRKSTYDVTWMANGVDWSEHGTPTTSGVSPGGKVSSLPTAPTSAACDDSKVFVGWSASEIDGEDDDAPDDLFTTADGAPTVDDDVTYYAVFATSSGGGSGNIQLSYTSLSLTTSYESGSTKSVSDVDFYCNDIMTGPSGSDGYQKIQFKKSSTGPGYIYNSEILPGNITSIVFGSTTRDMTVNFGTSSNPDGSTETTTCSSSSLTATPTGNYKYFKILNSVDNAAYTGTITINYSSISYSNYATTCTPACAEPTAASAGSFNSGTQKMPINWTSDAGKVDICYSTSSTKPDATPSASYTVVSNQTSSPVNLDVSGLSAGNYYCWVRSVCDASSTKSDWVAITGNTFTIPGHTLTITPSPAASGTFNQTSGQTVVEGRTVSITATPASGYTFSSWAVSGTGSTLSSTSTNPTTFTMGTANATVTATFSQIMVSSLTLRVQQTDQDDNTGDDLTMTCYPKEGQTGGNDPLSHTLKVLYDGALPSGALDKTVDWSVRVKAKGDADWTDVDFGGNALNSNSIINSFNKNTGLLKIASTEGTAEIKITAHDGSGVSAKVTITVANVAMTGVSVDPTSMSVYAGQKKQVAVTFTPANATDRSYSAGSSYTYVNIQNRAAASFNIEGKSSVTDADHEETVTVTTTDGSYTATIDVTVKPLPLAHFVDNIHNESFDDVVATTDGTTVTFAKATPTHDDLDEPGSGNTCEKTHLHLIGWIRGDWPAYVAYMNGTGSAPSNSDLTGATGYFYEAGAAITLTDAMHGKTFYAVWAVEE